VVEVLKRITERLGGDFFNRDYEHQFMERELLFIGAGKNGCIGVGETGKCVRSPAWIQKSAARDCSFPSQVF
jgi:hypothetical protein